MKKTKRAPVALICVAQGGEKKVVARCFDWHGVWPVLLRMQRFYNKMRQNVWAESAEYPDVILSDNPATHFFVRALVADEEAMTFLVDYLTPIVIAHPVSPALDDDRLQALWEEFTALRTAQKPCFFEDFFPWLEAAHGFILLKYAASASGVWHPESHEIS